MTHRNNVEKQLLTAAILVTVYFYFFILLRFIATNQQKYIIMKDKQNNKQLDLPDSSRLVRRQFQMKKTPSVHQSHRGSLAASVAPCQKRPTNLYFRPPASTLPKSFKLLLNNFAAKNNIDFCPLFVLNFAVVIALLVLSPDFDN